ncbi:hypothetical protein D3C78_1738210 [compost metagenome]
MICLAVPCQLNGILRLHLALTTQTLKHTSYIGDLYFQTLPRGIQLLGEACYPTKLGFGQVVQSFEPFPLSIPISLRPPQTKNLCPKPRLESLMLL